MSEMISGRYELLSSLGRGGMGEVFLANDTVLRRRVAIKRILRANEAGPDSLSVERLVREARLAAMLHHPNIVAVHDLLSENGTTFIVMEFVQAQSLAELIRAKQQVEPVIAARIIGQIAGALEAAHRAGVIHRDVKPANILVEDSGVAKLADFGIARADNDVSITGTGVMVGSIPYLPPEVAKGEALTTAADVYSLGSTFFAAVEGHAPFVRQGGPTTSVQILARLLTEPAPSALEAGPFADLIRRMMVSDPKERPTAGQVQRDLAVVLSEAGAVGGDRIAGGSPGVGADVVTVPPTQTPRDDDKTVLRVTDLKPEPGAEQPSAQPSAAPLPATMDPSDDAVTLGARKSARVSTPGGPSGEAQAGGSDVGASPRVTRGRARNRVLLVAGLGTALVVAGAWAVVARQQGVPSGPAQLEVATTSRAEPTSRQAVTPSAGISSAPRVSLKVVDTMKVGKWPASLALDSAAGRLYVANADYDSGHTITVMDLGQGSKLKTILVGRTPSGISLDSDAGRLYVSELRDDRVALVDTSTGKVTARITVGNGPAVTALDPVNGRLFVSLYSTALTVVDVVKLKSIGTVGPNEYPDDMAYDAGAERVYVGGSMKKRVLVIDGTSRKVLDSIGIADPRGMAVDSASSRLYVANFDRNEVVVIDTSTNEIVGAVKVKGNPGDVAVDSSRGLVFVTSWNGQSVTAIDTGSLTVAGSARVGGYPTAPVVDAANGKLYVANAEDGTVSVVRIG